MHSHNGRTANMHIAHSCKVFGSGAKKGEESFTAGVSSPQVIITQYTFEIFCSGYVFFYSSAGPLCSTDKKEPKPKPKMNCICDAMN